MSASDFMLRHRYGATRVSPQGSRSLPVNDQLYRKDIDGMINGIRSALRGSSASPFFSSSKNAVIGSVLSVPILNADLAESTRRYVFGIVSDRVLKSGLQPRVFWHHIPGDSQGFGGFLSVVFIY